MKIQKLKLNFNIKRDRYTERETEYRKRGRVQKEWQCTERETDIQKKRQIYRKKNRVKKEWQRYRKGGRGTERETDVYVERVTKIQKKAN